MSEISFKLIDESCGLLNFFFYDFKHEVLSGRGRESEKKIEFLWIALLIQSLSIKIGLDFIMR